MINIGFGNLINKDRVVVIVNADSAPAKRLISGARDAGTLVDATQGRRTKSLIVTDSGCYVLSGLTTETLLSRFESDGNGGKDN